MVNKKEENKNPVVAEEIDLNSLNAEEFENNSNDENI